MSALEEPAILQERARAAQSERNIQNNITSVAREIAVLPGRIIGSWALSLTSLFFSFVALWPLLFTNRNAYGGLGEQFTSLWFWAVPAAIGGLVLSLGYRRIGWREYGLGKISAAIILAAVALITSLVVGIVLFIQLPV